MSPVNSVRILPDELSEVTSSGVEAILGHRTCRKIFNLHIIYMYHVHFLKFYALYR